MRVHIPTALRSYTDQVPSVEIRGKTVGALIDALERKYPGFRFRILDETGRVREHIKILVDALMVEDLATPVSSTQELHIVMALSGG